MTGCQAWKLDQILPLQPLVRRQGRGATCYLAHELWPWLQYDVTIRKGRKLFLAGDHAGLREKKIRLFLLKEPSIALLVAAVNFEWTVSRAIIFLSETPNAQLRKKMFDYHSPKKYNILWRQEAVPQGHPSLARLVSNWEQVLDAFTARNLIVHGKGRYTKNMATPHVEALIEAVACIDAYCIENHSPLHKRMPVRRKPKK